MHKVVQKHFIDFYGLNLNWRIFFTKMDLAHFFSSVLVDFLHSVRTFYYDDNDVE
jgi:hypothetical protein